MHGNQEPQSWATITWDNAFAETTRIPFQVPDKVPWPRLADALNSKFNFATDKILTDQNLMFLCKLFICISSLRISLVCVCVIISSIYLVFI